MTIFYPAPTSLSSPSHGSVSLGSLLDHTVLDHVHEILAANLNSAPQHDRRADRRVAFPYIMDIRPADQPAAQATAIVGRHISYLGLDFYHQQTLPFRRWIVSLETPSKQPLQILIDVNWCRFIRQNWYLSGGRFLKVLRP
jgi:hypothetical protein